MELLVVTEDEESLLREQFSEVQQKYSGLKMTFRGSGAVIEGNLRFSASYDGKKVKDEYGIEITIPEDYPENPPLAKETRRKIPKSFHTYQDGTLCLGVPLAIKRFFAQHRNLFSFVDQLLVPYLFSHSYKKQYGKMPFGELEHGYPGLLNFYKKLFDIEDGRLILKLIKVIVDDKYRGHLPCPCGSDKIMRNCHGALLLEIKKYPHNFLKEYIGLLNLLKERKEIIDAREYISPQMVEKVKRLKTKSWAEEKEK